MLFFKIPIRNINAKIDKFFEICFSEMYKGVEVTIPAWLSLFERLDDLAQRVRILDDREPASTLRFIFGGRAKSMILNKAADLSDLELALARLLAYDVFKKKGDIRFVGLGGRANMRDDVTPSTCFLKISHNQIALP